MTDKETKDRIVDKDETFHILKNRRSIPPDIENADGVCA